MNISRVIIHGFRSYKDTVSFGPFSPGQNALVGLNGSGKSNFYKAIEFVLLDEYAHIRVSDRKSILHEGTASNAYVEIIFDNSGEHRPIPIDQDEVSIRRSVSLKKDEYFINHKHSTWQDVHNLLESCGFSPSSGYYIVRQGKVAGLAKMKDPERLDLLMDIAGTKFYDAQRKESVKIIAESEERQSQIGESLQYITDRLKQLSAEKEELQEYEKVESEHRALEYLIQQRELKRINEELTAFRDEKEVVNHEADETRAQLEQIKADIKNFEEEIESFDSQIKNYNLSKAELQASREKAVKSLSRANYKHGELSEKHQNTETHQQKVHSDLEGVEASIQRHTDSFKAANDEFNDVATRKAEIDGEILGLEALIGGQVESAKQAAEDLKKATHEVQEAKRASGQASSAAKAVQDQIDELNEQLQRIQEQLAQKESQRNEAQAQKAQAQNQRKELWRQQNFVEREIAQKEQRLRQLRLQIDHSVPTAFATGLSSLQQYKQADSDTFSGIFGPVFEQIQCEPEYATAISVAGRASLYHVIVDKADTAKAAMTKLNADKGGRATFLPLDRVQPASLDDLAPEDAEHAHSILAHISYPPACENAFKHVFGRTALCDTLQKAVDIAHKYHISCVTLDGVLVSGRGLMTGGYRPDTHSPLAIAAAIAKTANEVAELKEKFEGLGESGREAEESLKSAREGYERLDREAGELDLEISKIRLELRAKEGERSKLSKKAEDAEKKLNERERMLATVSRRSAALSEFSKTKSKEAEAAEQLENAKDARAELTRQYNELFARRQEIFDKLKNKLIPRRNRLLDELSALDVSRLARALEGAAAEVGHAKEALAEIEGALVEVEEKAKEGELLKAGVEEQLKPLAQEREKRQKELNSQEKILGRLESKIIMRKQREAASVAAQRNLGPKPFISEDLLRLDGQDLLTNLQNCNEELSKRFVHVNKRASEQFKAFSEQEKELTDRMQELENSKESIITLIAGLDEKKMNAIMRTFSEVSEHFAAIFRQLVPEGQGELILQKDERDAFTGVAVHVKFNDGGESLSINQLSGGQNTLVALALLFAIQRFAPAPFYLFDEVDSALDANHREAVAALINQQCHPQEEQKQAQVILTTFKPELLNGCDKYFAVKVQNDTSEVTAIDQEVAEKIISENPGDAD